MIVLTIATKKTPDLFNDRTNPILAGRFVLGTASRLVCVLRTDAAGSGRVGVFRYVAELGSDGYRQYGAGGARCFYPIL